LIGGLIQFGRNMIDISHSEALKARRGSDEHAGSSATEAQTRDDEEDDLDDEEAAWLQSVQEDNLAAVQGMQSGTALVMDPGELRDDHQGRKAARAKTSG